MKIPIFNAVVKHGNGQIVINFVVREEDMDHLSLSTTEEEKLEIMRQWLRDEQIEFKLKDSTMWGYLPNTGTTWNWKLYDYRVKTTPRYIIRKKCNQRTYYGTYLRTTNCFTWNDVDSSATIFTTKEQAQDALAAHFCHERHFEIIEVS